MRNAIKKIVWGVLGLVRTSFDPIFNFREVAVLCYHSISDSPHTTAITPQALKSHLEALKARGVVFVSLNDIAAWIKGERALPRKAVALTFDDGYADFESAAMPILNEYKAPAAVFVVGEPAEAAQRMDDTPLLSLAQASALRVHPHIEVGYHSKTHPNVAKLGAGDLQAEVTPLFPARYFAYPGGNHSPQVAEALKAAGYEAAFTIRPVLVRQGVDPMYIPRAVILKGMTARDVARRVSVAADWYYRLTHLV